MEPADAQGDHRPFLAEDLASDRVALPGQALGPAEVLVAVAQVLSPARLRGPVGLL